MQHLRTVLVTPTHKDARITAFLTTWAFEKYWIADALSAILSAHEAAGRLDARIGAQARLPRGARALRPDSRVARRQPDRRADDRRAHVGRRDRRLGHPGRLRPHLRARAEPRAREDDRDDPRHQGAPPHLLRAAVRVPPRRVDRRAEAHPQAPRRSRRGRSAPTSFRASDRQYFFDRLFRSSTGLAESIDTAIDGLPGLTGLGLIARAAGTRSAA